MSVGAVNKQTGDRIPTAGMPAIDDALDLTSVNPVQNAIITAALGDKQDSTDNNLQTTDKTIVGAINEHEGDIGSLMSGLTNKIMISNHPLNLVCLNDISVSFTNGDSLTDVSRYIPSGYQLSFVMASPVNTSTISVTGCKIYNSSNVEIKCRTDFTGNTDFNIMLFVRKSS